MMKRAVWAKHMGEWQRSGQTQRAYCAKRGLALSTFQWWRGKLRRVEQQDSEVAFLPLALNAAPSNVAVIEVELRSKTRLRLEGEAALRALGAVVARIR